LGLLLGVTAVATIIVLSSLTERLLSGLSQRSVAARMWPPPMRVWPCLGFVLLQFALPSSAAREGQPMTALELAVSGAILTALLAVLLLRGMRDSSLWWLFGYGAAVFSAAMIVERNSRVRATVLFCTLAGLGVLAHGVVVSLRHRCPAGLAGASTTTSA
jgi:hypothetical protein